MQIPKSNVTPMVRTAPVDPKFLMMAAAMMKGEGKLDPKLDPKDVKASKLQLAQSPLQQSGHPSTGAPIPTKGGPNPGQVAGSSMT